jgi:hypothetical protein
MASRHVLWKTWLLLGHYSNWVFSFESAAIGSYPEHCKTGSLGYFGKLGSVFERWQK